MAVFDVVRLFKPPTYNNYVNIQRHPQTERSFDETRAARRYARQNCRIEANVRDQHEWLRGFRFWAKTAPEGEPGISVRDHCLNVGCVAEALLAAVPKPVLALLPTGAVMLAALHDVGKITLGFQVKCSRWLQSDGLPKFSPGEAALSISDHALVSQVFLQKLLSPAPARLWAVAVGSHHGRPKGRNARINPPEAVTEWAEENRLRLMEDLRAVFGPLPTTPPDPRLDPYHSDLWLLAGLISVADWIGSNEAPRINAARALVAYVDH